jgi:DNA-binding Xre family transcriptional regulator
MKKRNSRKNWPFRAFMIDRGVHTASELAKRCGVSDSMVHFIISGKEKPSPRLLGLMCRALRCGPVELVEKLTGGGKE